MERPILFNGDMVRAILGGRKTQTRRIIQNGKFAESVVYRPPSARIAETTPGGEYVYYAHCPFGEVGDRLWVRETWAKIYKGDACMNSDLGLDCHECDGCVIEYKADTGNKYPGAWPEDEKDNEMCGRWTPSIHIPRWASRILLEITGIRIERLNDISEIDAESEGVGFLRDVPDADERLTARELFMCLWDSVYKKRGGGWDTNPWVWVIEFKVAEVKR